VNNHLCTEQVIRNKFTFFNSYRALWEATKSKCPPTKTSWSCFYEKFSGYSVPVAPLN